MASGDTKTNQYLDIAANGGDFPASCCETRSQTLIRGVGERITAVETEVEEMKNNPDVVDIVATYADLQAYDTSKLGDNDIIRVLEDETHDGDSSYYRFNKSAGTWTYIASVEASDVNEYVIKGAGAPTTATVGTVGMLYEDTTNGKLYQCTAATPGTDPDPDTYTWEEVGGSSINVVQSTGTSTTNVMSQNATSKMVFKDAANKRIVQIGSGASGGDDGSISIGYNAKNYAGPGGSFITTVATAIGYGATTYAGKNIAIGQNAVAGVTQQSNIESVAIGYDAKATDTASTAIGASSKSQARGSIAIGAYSVATTTGQMDIGSTVTSCGYNSSNYRLLTGLYDGQSAHDAATYGQVISYSAINGAGAPTTATEGKYVGQLYYDTTNEEMYFLKTIDTTTDPATYTWESLGGGSSVNVVQTTGDSQTDVMSQNATTKMIYPDTSTKNRVSIGSGDAAIAKNISIFGTLSSISGSTPCIALGGKISVVNGTSIAIGNNSEIMGSQSGEGYSIAIGSGCKTTGGHGISIGYNCRAGYNTNQGYNIAIGINSNAYYSSNSQMQGALAVGYGANTSSSSSIAIGRSTTLDSYCSNGIGIGANATMYNSENSVLLGRNSTATNVQNSVGLGSYSKPTVSGQVDISTNASTSNYGYNGSKYRLLSGVYDPQSDHDAATKGYVDTAVAATVAQGNTLATSAPDTTTEGVLGQLYTDTTNMHTYQCTAIDTTDPDNPSYTWQMRW